MSPSLCTPPKIRWFRFSLRSFAIVLTIGCLLVGFWVHRAERQRAVVKWVEENGGRIYYEFDSDNQPFGADWIGEDFFSPVVCVGFSFIEKTEVSDISPLGQLSNVRSLWLYNSNVSDLEPLAQLTNLERLSLRRTLVHDVTPLSRLPKLVVLDLSFTQVNDLTPLAGVSSLEELQLDGTPVTQEQVDELQESLTNCEIRGVPRARQSRQETPTVASDI